MKYSDQKVLNLLQSMFILAMIMLVIVMAAVMVRNTIEANRLTSASKSFPTIFGGANPTTVEECYALRRTMYYQIVSLKGKDQARAKDAAAIRCMFIIQNYHPEFELK